MKSVKDVEKIVDLSRRKIQEYEKAGVTAKPIHKTNRGYLRYDEQDIGRLMKIRFYRGLGYSQPEIRRILLDTDSERRSAVTAKLPELNKRKAELENLITILVAMQDKQLPEGIFTGSIPGLGELPYPLLISSLSAGIEEAQSGSLELCIPELSDQELNHCLEIVEAFMNLIRSGHSPEASEAQQQITSLIFLLKPVLPPSSLVLSWFSQFFMAGTELHTDIDEIFGTGSGDALYKGIQKYCQIHKDSAMDRLLTGSLQNIERLARKGYPASDETVQAQVASIHKFFRKAGIFYPPIQALAGIGRLFARDAIRQCIDSGLSYAPAHYFSDAIEIYCDNRKEEEST